MADLVYVVSRKKMPGERLGKNFYFVPERELVRSGEEIVFRKTKIKKYRPGMRMKRLGFIILAYSIPRQNMGKRKITNRAIARSLGIPLSPSLYAFPYVEHSFHKLNHYKTVARVIEDNGGRVKKVASLLPENTMLVEERIKDYLEKGFLRIEAICRKEKRSSRKATAELSGKFKFLRMKSDFYSGVYGFTLKTLERRTYNLLGKKKHFLGQM